MARKKIVVTAAKRRTIGQCLAAATAGFLPVAAYVLAHFEVVERPWLWSLVGAALLYSAPTLADWAFRWTASRAKAWGFTVLLEGVMIGAHSPWLSLARLALLVGINGYSGYVLAGAKLKQ